MDPRKPDFSERIEVTHSDGSQHILQVDGWKDGMNGGDLVLSDQSPQPGLDLNRYRDQIAELGASQGFEPDKTNFIEQDWQGSLNEHRLSERDLAKSVSPEIEVGFSKWTSQDERPITRDELAQRGLDVPQSQAELAESWKQETFLSESQAVKHDYLAENQRDR